MIYGKRLVAVFNGCLEVGQTVLIYFLLLSFFVASVYASEDIDIRIGQRGGKLTVHRAVHLSDIQTNDVLGDGTVWATDNPGFIASGFAFEDEFFFDVTGPLKRWDGNIWSADNLTTEQIAFFEPSSQSPPNNIVTVNKDTTFAAGFLIARATTRGTIHVHNVFQLSATEGTPPAVGAYGLQMTLHSPQYNRSAPFYILLNNGLSQAEFDAAVVAFRGTELLRTPALAYAFTPLELVESAGDKAVRINNDGVIAGSLDGTDGITRGYLYQDGTESERFVWPDATFTEFWGVNISGQTVGYYADPNDSTFNTFVSFLREADQSFTSIDWPPGQPVNFGIDVNASGQVLGQSSIQSWLRAPDGTHTELQIPEFSTHAGWGLNDHGEVVGVAWPGFFDTPNGFIYDPVSRTFDIWNYPGAIETVLHDINNQGDIVGTFKASIDTEEQSFIRWSDGTHQLLQVPEAASTRVWSMNDQRTIVGRLIDPEGRSRSFMARIEPMPMGNITLDQLPQSGSVGFILVDGVMHLFQMPDTTGTSINHISPDGTRAYGWFTNPEVNTQGFELDLINNTFTPIVLPNTRFTIIRGGYDDKLLGKLADDVGTPENPDDDIRKGFIYDTQTQQVEVFVRDGFDDIGFTSMNSQGVITGFNDFGAQGFLFANGAFIDLDDPGAFRLFPFQINDLGQFVGFWGTSEETWFLNNINPAFTGTFDGQSYTVDRYELPGFAATGLTGINNQGRMTGIAYPSSASRPVLFSVANPAAEPELFPLPDHLEPFPTGIDNRGWIYGQIFLFEVESAALEP